MTGTPPALIADQGPRIIAALPLPPTDVYVSPISWYGGYDPEPVLLVGSVIYETGWTASIILESGTTQVLDGDCHTVDTLDAVEGWPRSQRRAA